MEYRAYWFTLLADIQTARLKLQTCERLYGVDWQVLEIRGKRQECILVLIAPDDRSMVIMTAQVHPARRVELGPNIKMLLRRKGFKVP